jgi:hypothetical protein
MSKFIIADTTINVINAAEAQIAGLKADNKANNEAANAQKISAYCELIATLAPVKLVKGNLPRAVSKTLRAALLEEAGLKEATAKRYIENSVGAIRLFDLSGMDNATPQMVREFLDTSGIDSENKLAKAVKGETEKSKAQMLAEQVVGKWSTAKDDDGKIVQGNVFKDGLSDEELDEFQNVMRELMAARQAYRNSDAAKAAQAGADRENETVDAAVAAFVAEGLGEFWASSDRPYSGARPHACGRDLRRPRTILRQRNSGLDVRVIGACTSSNRPSLRGARHTRGASSRPSKTSNNTSSTKFWAAPTCGRR